MAKPVQLCKLTAGKALAAFPNFVATFNWLVDFCNNLRGEGEDVAGNPDKKVTVDRSVDDHPVIRGGAGGESSDVNLAAATDNVVINKYEDEETGDIVHSIGVDKVEVTAATDNVSVETEEVTPDTDDEEEASAKTINYKISVDKSIVESDSDNVSVAPVVTTDPDTGESGDVTYKVAVDDVVVTNGSDSNVVVSKSTSSTTTESGNVVKTVTYAIDVYYV